MYFEMDSSPTLALLRARTAGIVLSFYRKVFKEEGNDIVSEERLEGRWETFLETEVPGSGWEGDVPDPKQARATFERWCKDKWLARSYEEDAQCYAYRLTSHAERALLFSEEMLQAGLRGFVGTESGFSKIWSALGELTEKTDENFSSREKLLLAERDRVDQEIEELRRTRQPRVLDATAVKSRVHDVVRMVTAFLSDFRAVEDEFRRQRDIIQNLYLEQERSRGDIVEYSLDATEQLKDSDMGRSFFGFQRMLRSTDRAEELRRRVEHVAALAKRHQIDPVSLQGLLFKLHRELDRVQETYGRIAKQLHVVVEESFRRDRRLALDAVAQIKRLAHQVRDRPPANAGMTVMLNVKVVPFMGVRFHDRARRLILNNTIVDDVGLGLDEFFSKVGPGLRLKEIRQLIQEELEAQPHITLSEMVGRHPLQQGIVDLLCYLFVAGGSARHEIVDRELDLEFEEDGLHRVACVPEIIYRRSQTWQKSA